MRLLTVFSVFLLTTSHAYAIDAPGWQKQLQAEMDAVQKTSPFVKARGSVMVEDVDGGQMRALLPAMTITNDDKTTWDIPAIALQAPVTNNATAPVKISLPKKFQQLDANQQSTATVTLGSQSLQGNWNFQHNAFETLSGTIGKIIFDSGATTSSAADKIVVTADNGGTAKLAVTGISGSSHGPQGSNAVQAQSADVTYNFSGDKRFGVMRVIGLLNPAMLLAANEKLGLATDVKAAQFTTPSGRTTRFDTLTTRMQIEPTTKGQSVGIRSEINATNVQQTPGTYYAAFLPKTATIIGTISNAPLELLAMVPGQGGDEVKAAMVKAQTRSDISKIALKLQNDLILNGTGWLKATAGVPTGFVGQFKCHIDDLAAVTSATQRALLQPGTDKMQLTQNMMALMAVQGMTRENSAGGNDVVIDLTPDGKILLNGQDVGGLLGGGSGRNAVAVPVAPVASTPL